MKRPVIGVLPTHSSGETMLKVNMTYIVAALPDEYYKSPKAIRAKIRQNEKIIKQRKKEVKQNKGMYSPEPHIRR